MEKKFLFIDLFAGIGGIRLGFEQYGKCVFTSEWDKYCQKTYAMNFRDEHPITGDITKIPSDEIPDHNLLLAGFPCQSFSVAGKKKGFNDCRGTLFFDVVRIIAKKKPQAFLLENVKNLLSHDKGNTFKVICTTLKEHLGYDIHYKVINAKHFVPQNRERVIIVGFSQPKKFSWDAIKLPQPTTTLQEILHPRNENVHQKYTLTDRTWKCLQNHAEKHQKKGNGFGFGLVGTADVARTLSARYFKDGSEILLKQERKNPRRLTPKECSRLMGFPNDFLLEGVSDTQLYKQFGNSVVVPVIEYVAKLMLPFLYSTNSTKD